MTLNRWDFNSSSFDWQSYLRYRPPYPARLFDTIYSWHTEHGNRWSLACDVGSGIGNVAAELAKRFEAVESSDPSEVYVNRAKQYIANDPSIKDKISYAVRRAEEPMIDLAGKVDLITIAMAIHWTNHAEALRAASQSLRPGGTLAIWIYASCPFALRAPSERVRKLLADVHQKWRTSSGPPLGGKPFVPTTASRLDVLDFGAGDWSSVGRVHWSAGHGMVGFETAYVDWETRVGEKDIVDWRPTDHLITVVADIESIKGYYRILLPDIDSAEVCREEFARLESELAGRNMELCWPVSLVLATKR